MKRVLVITGDGINCERESARAFEDAGAKVAIQHINFLLREPRHLRDFEIICFPGGFSFGDELKSGKIFSEKLRERMMPEINQVLDRGGLILGVCNGFQVLMQLGVFGEQLTLTTNSHHEFRDFWVECQVTAESKSSPWFSRVDTDRLLLPIRHKEGRVMGQMIHAKPALQYTEDVNGSLGQTAGLLDQSGQILGLMPHPEAATHSFLNPLFVSEDQKAHNAQSVRKLFEGAVHA